MQNQKLNRRRFLRNSSLGFLGAGLLGKPRFAIPLQDQETELPKIKEYRILGWTGFKVSNIGFGMPMNPGLIRAAIQSGVTYFDTSQFYGTSESDIGEAIQEFDRNSLFITTKMHSRYLGPKEDIMTMPKPIWNYMVLQTMMNNSGMWQPGLYYPIRMWIVL